MLFYLPSNKQLLLAYTRAIYTKATHSHFRPRLRHSSFLR